MTRWPKSWKDISAWVLHRRWQIAFLLAMIDSLVEFLEHRPKSSSHVGLVLFAVILPIFLGLALSGIVHLQSQMIQACNEAQQAEREQLVHQLHDSVGQQLAYLQLKLERLSSHGDRTDLAAMRRELQDMRAMVQEANRLVRSALRELDMPLQTDLVSALQELAQRVAARAGFELSFSSKGPQLLLGPDAQRHIISIVREALANIERHARAGHVAIQLTWTHQSQSIQLTDDGVGFDPDAVTAGHLGLALMRDRAEQIGGQLVITSRPGKGTDVALSVPLSASLRGNPFPVFLP